MESMSAAAKYYGYDWLMDSQGRFQEAVESNTFENLALLEFQVMGAFSPRELEGISQGEQAPYLEAFLDVSGTKRLSEKEAIQTDGRRVCFFLHFLDIHQPIWVGHHGIELQAMSELPERLLGLVPYLPPD